MGFLDIRTGFREIETSFFLQKKTKKLMFLRKNKGTFAYETRKQIEVVS